MSSRVLAPLLALALLWAPQASAAISAPTLLTADYAATAGPYTTASVTAPANAFTFVVVSSTSALTALAVSNGVDTWTCAPVTTASGAGRVGICYTYSAGFTGTLTITPTGATTRANWVVGYATNSVTTSILDKTGTVSVSATNVTTVSPNATLATLSQADELIIAPTMIGGTSGTVTDSGTDAFTKLTEDQAASGNPNLAVFYKVTTAINGAGTGYAYGTSWTNAHSYTAMLWSFKGSGSAAVSCSVTLTGAGAC